MNAPPCCPRCGYDLSGLIAIWTEHCPLQARCSECGLDFDCGNVLSARMLGPEWSFEHASGLALRKWRLTSWRALRIVPMTNGLRVDHAVRPRRLIGFGLSWLLLGWLFASLLAFFVNPDRRWWGNSLPGSNLLGMRDSLNIGEWFLLLRDVAWPYGEMYIAIGGWWPTDFSLRPLLIITYTPVLVVPLAMLVLDTTLARARVRKVHLLRGWAYSMPAAVIAAHGTALALITFIIIRGTSAIPVEYSLPMLLLCALLAILLMCALPVWLLAWWWSFLKRHLRIGHALITSLLMMLQAALVTVILLIVLALARW